jgi:hypothetical protein
MQDKTHQRHLSEKMLFVLTIVLYILLFLFAQHYCMDGCVVIQKTISVLLPYGISHLFI